MSLPKEGWRCDTLDVIKVTFGSLEHFEVTCDVGRQLARLVCNQSSNLLAVVHRVWWRLVTVGICPEWRCLKLDRWSIRRGCL